MREGICAGDRLKAEPLARSGTHPGLQPQRTTEAPLLTPRRNAGYHLRAQHGGIPDSFSPVALKGGPWPVPSAPARLQICRLSGRMPGLLSWKPEGGAQHPDLPSTPLNQAQGATEPRPVRLSKLHARHLAVVFRGGQHFHTYLEWVSP